MTKIKVGDRVVVPFTISCGECFFCKRGFYSGCERTNPDKAKAAMPGYIDVFRVDLRHIDRAAAEGTAGFVKVGAWGGELWDATVVGPHAGELIGTISLAMTNGVGLKRIAETVFPYPTYTEALRKIGDQYNRTRLTPRARWLLGAWLRWFR